MSLCGALRKRCDVTEGTRCLAADCFMAHIGCRECAVSFLVHLLLAGRRDAVSPQVHIARLPQGVPQRGTATHHSRELPFGGIIDKAWPRTK